jgi:hypothetical protein
MVANRYTMVMAMTDHRHSTRQKSLLRGIVYFDNNPCAVECVLRDISDKGARAKFVDLPATAAEWLDLRIPIKAQRHRCKIVWCSDNELGLAFVDAAAPESPDAMAERMARLEAEIEALKRVVRSLKNGADAASAA